MAYISLSGATPGYFPRYRNGSTVFDLLMRVNTDSMIGHDIALMPDYFLKNNHGRKRLTFPLSRINVSSVSAQKSAYFDRQPIKAARLSRLGPVKPTDTQGSYTTVDSFLRAKRYAIRY